MKILVNGLPLIGQKTGIGHYTHQLVSRLSQSGHVVFIFLGHAWQESNLDAAEPVDKAFVTEQSTPQRSRWQKVFRLSAWRKLLWHYAVQIKRILMPKLPKLRQVADKLMQKRFNAGPAGQVSFEPNFIAMRTGLPTVVTVHDLSWLHYPETHPADRVRFIRTHFDRVMRQALKVITVSSFVKAELEQHFPITRGKVVTVHNGVDHEAYHPRDQHQTQPTLTRYGITYGQFFILLGTLEPRKNIETAIRAHAQLTAHMQQQFPLVLVGASGWRTSSIESAMRPGLAAGTIRVLGYVTDEECRDIVASACALIYPSRYEGFGLPPLEAMASGVPVIASNTSAMPEVIGDAGLLCAVNDSHAFAQAMSLLTNDAEQRALWVQRGLVRAQAFSWARCASETEAVLRSVALAVEQSPKP